MRKILKMHTSKADEINAAYNEYIRCLQKWYGDDEQFFDSLAMITVIDCLTSLAELQYSINYTCIYKQPGGEQETHEFHNDNFDVKVSGSEMFDLWIQMRHHLMVDFQQFLESHNQKRS